MCAAKANRFPRLGAFRVAAALLAGAAAFAAAATAAPAHWSAPVSLAALGALSAVRRPREETEADGWRKLTGELIVRHRLDGWVTGVEGDGAAQFDPGRFQAHAVLERLHDEDRLRFLAQASAVAGDGAPRACALRLRDDLGECRHVEIATARNDGEGGLVSAFRLHGAVASLAADLEAARAEARLEKSLKDRLLANMSHELRTPLNAILGFSEILGDRALAPADDDKRMEYARIIHTSADHLLSVVNLVLDMSRIEAGKFAMSPEPLELAPLISECCDMLRLRAERGRVEIVVAPFADGLELVADKAACRQIVVNLLSNAVKFTPPEGQVTVEAALAGDHVRLSVTDTGIGIQPDDLPRLGDPFFQVKSGYNRSFEGAGLGLSLVCGLVGLHDGSLVLESAVGVGTRVTACLPLTQRPPTRPVSAARLHTIPRLTLPPLGAQQETRLA